MAGAQRARRRPMDSGRSRTRAHESSANRQSDPSPCRRAPRGCRLRQVIARTVATIEALSPTAHGPDRRRTGHPLRRARRRRLREGATASHRGWSPRRAGHARESDNPLALSSPEQRGSAKESREPSQGDGGEERTPTFRVRPPHRDAGAPSGAPLDDRFIGTATVRFPQELPDESQPGRPP